MSKSIRVATAIAAGCLFGSIAFAQPVSRLKGRVVTEKGEPVKDADVRAEAYFGYAAGNFAGQRTFGTKTDGKGEWTIIGLKSGVWLFEVSAAGRLPETVALPIQMLVTVSSGASGLMLPWQLILKPATVPDTAYGSVLATANEAAHTTPDKVRTMMTAVPDDVNGDWLGGAGRIVLTAGDPGLAIQLFKRALERDPSSYRAALGIASASMLLRDFDTASRAFAAARERTHDKDEQKFISAALDDLRNVKVSNK
jgi:tetratricopeptide (TPR) repeat protein